jgi:hypothetical protein
MPNDKNKSLTEFTEDTERKLAADPHRKTKKE